MYRPEQLQKVREIIEKESQKESITNNLDWKHTAASKILDMLFEKPKMLRIGGNGSIHFVDEVWEEKEDDCTMVGIKGEIKVRHERVFIGTLVECNEYVKNRRNV